MVRFLTLEVQFPAWMGLGGAMCGVMVCMDWRFVLRANLAGLCGLPIRKSREGWGTLDWD
jgi:hypothetical protein